MSPSGLQNGGCPCLCPGTESPLSPAQRVLRLTPPCRECSATCLARTLHGWLCSAPKAAPGPTAAAARRASSPPRGDSRGAASCPGATFSSAPAPAGPDAAICWKAPRAAHHRRHRPLLGELAPRQGPRRWHPSLPIPPVGTGCIWPQERTSTSACCVTSGVSPGFLTQPPRCQQLSRLETVLQRSLLHLLPAAAQLSLTAPSAPPNATLPSGSTTFRIRALLVDRKM